MGRKGTPGRENSLGRGLGVGQVGIVPRSSDVPDWLGAKCERRGWTWGAEGLAGAASGGAWSLIEDYPLS